MPMTVDEAVEYLRYNYYWERVPATEQEHLIELLMTQKHRPWCRKQLESIMPNYGSECTCPERDDSPWLR